MTGGARGRADGANRASDRAEPPSHHTRLRGGLDARATRRIGFAALLAAPIVVVAIGGAALVAREAEARRAAARRDADLRLQTLSGELAALLGDLEAELLAALRELPERDGLEAVFGVPGVEPAVDALAALSRTHPLVVATFALDARGQRTYPPSGALATADEQAFVARTRAIWSGVAPIYVPPRPEGAPAASSLGASTRPREAKSASAPPPGPSTGWLAWHWEEGLHLLFYVRRARDTLGVELDRTALVARYVGRLPNDEPGGARVSLVDARGDVVYAWGHAPWARPPPTLASVALPHPLDSYRLTYVVEGGDTPTGLGPPLALAAVVLALVALAFVVARERGRALREAEARMSFVTQVSHELKTPLTNIRLYAELLGEALEGLDDDAVEAPRRHLAVIELETQRLSRLIHDVLSFSRRQSGRLELHPREVDVGELVARVLAQFAPAFAAKGLVATLRGAAPAPRSLDPDAVAQILGNLLSNAEKYAASGRAIEVELAQDSASTTIAVRDHGPGVAAAERARIFEPFYRSSDALSDGAAGTGIGLTIARALAELHGGALVVEDAAPGARFRLTLPHPLPGAPAPGASRS
jgi:signal transduction histidine kinase